MLFLSLMKRLPFFCLALLCLIGNFSKAQTTKVAELQKKLGRPMADSSRLRLLYELTAAYSSVDMEKKLYYARYYKKMAEQLKVDTMQVEALIDIGGYYGIQSKMDSALYYFSKGYKKARESHYEIGEARSLASIGFVYSKQDKYKNAVSNYFLALRIYKKHHHYKGINQCYINIGSIYFDSAQYALAETYFSAALKSYTEINDQKGIGAATFSLGNANKRLHHFNLAKSYYARSLQIRERLGDLNGIALANWGLGTLEIEQGNYDKALVNLEIALKHDRTLKNTYHETAVLVSIAEAYLGLKDFKNARNNAEMALSNGYAINSKNSRLNTYKILIKIAKAENDIRKAFRYQTEFIALGDSIENDKILKDMMQAEFKRVASENDGLTKDNRIIASENTDYFKTIIATSFLLLFVVILLFTYYKRNLEKNQTNKLLQKQKEEIASINSELQMLNHEVLSQMELTSAQNCELEKLNAVKNKFFSIVSHDLRSPLSTLQMLFRLYREGELDENEIGSLLLKLEESIYTTGSFLDNLLEWSKSQLEGMKINPVVFDLTAIITQNLDLSDSQIRLKELDIQNLVDGKAIMVYADPNMISVVVRNLISNSIKFCRPADTILLDILENETVAVLTVKDTGPGISENDMQKLFSLEHTVSKGTHGEKGHHIGLVLCKDMIEQNKGRISVESRIGGGTIFRVELPKY